MTFPRPAAFPGGRVLAGWWKQLAPWRPQSLWVGSVTLERVETLCGVQFGEPLAPLDKLLLNNLSVGQVTDSAALVRRLGIDEVLLTRLLARLEKKGIVNRTASCWSLTEAGVEAQSRNVLPGQRFERRSFWFICDPLESSSAAFVSSTIPGALQSLESGRLQRGSFEALRECFNRDAEWKQSRQFPLHVTSVIEKAGHNSGDELAAWEKIVVVHPHRMQAALITYVRETGQPGVAAFSYHEHGWALGSTPVFDIAADWKDLFPGLPLDADESTISEAWRKWLTQRGVAGQMMERYRIESRNGRIGVAATDGSAEILGGPRSDLARGEAWLVLHEGALRRVMPLEAQPATESGKPVARPIG